MDGGVLISTRPRSRYVLEAAIGVLVLLLAGCSGLDAGEGAVPSPSAEGVHDEAAQPAADDRTAEDPGAEDAGAEDVPPASSAADAGEPDRPERCTPTTAQPVTGDAAMARVLDVGGEGRPRVEGVVYPLPGPEGDPWSHWGQGVVLRDGRYWSAAGDHLGRDGNSYFYSYDPTTSTLTRFADVLSNVPHQAGAWGYGKVHGQLVVDGCGDVWAATYWGSRRGLTFVDGYQGDLLLRLDPASYEVELVGTPAPGRGVPSLAGAPGVDRLYGEAVEPVSDEGTFFVVDLGSGEVIEEQMVAGHTGFRNILVDAAGDAYFAVGEGRLARYRPDTGVFDVADLRLPGAWLRSSTAPDLDGTVYAGTRDPDHWFAMDPDGEIRDLGPARGYAASVALHPDGGAFLYVPDAHGGSHRQGTPLLSVDGATGQHTTVVELQDLAVDAFGLRLGGTYSVAVDPASRIVYITLNAGAAGEESFGEVVLMIVHLP